MELGTKPRNLQKQQEHSMAESSLQPLVRLVLSGAKSQNCGMKVSSEYEHSVLTVIENKLK